jgi:hypothetical protein
LSKLRATRQWQLSSIVEDLKEQLEANDQLIAQLEQRIAQLENPQPASDSDSEPEDEPD